jgi:ATP-dependent exoDNAse (exonuclease V) alpha subunit
MPVIDDLVKTRIPQRFGLNPIRDIQVLCPMNRGGVGARSLNIELQAALNPAGNRQVERFGKGRRFPDFDALAPEGVQDKSDSRRPPRRV